MTKKDYEAVAKVIKARKESDFAGQGSSFRNNDVLDTLKVVAKDLATLYQADNPQFNRSRFLTACGF